MPEKVEEVIEKGVEAEQVNEVVIKDEQQHIEAPEEKFEDCLEVHEKPIE